MEWARSLYARRALVRRCLLVRGFVRRTLKFDDYLTVETLAGQENSHERVDRQGGDRDWRLQGHRRGDRETARRRGRFGGL